jgi:hypothetical protein
MTLDVVELFKKASLTQAIDELTDAVAILVIGAMVLAGFDPSQGVLGAIAAIALGKRALQSAAQTGAIVGE